MKVLRKKYIIDGNLHDYIPELETLKEGVVVETVLVVEENTEEDKSGVKLGGGDEKGEEGEPEKETEGKKG